MNAGNVRRVAIEILDEFEELLDRKGIMIPSEDRAGREDDACIQDERHVGTEQGQAYVPNGRRLCNASMFMSAPPCQAFA